jgi:hypothetical protein
VAQLSLTYFSDAGCIILAMKANRTLVGAEACISAVFPDEASRPSLRSFREWQTRGYFPFVRVGRRTFFDPEDVRSALDRRFRVNAIAAQGGDQP